LEPQAVAVAAADQQFDSFVAMPSFGELAALELDSDSVAPTAAVVEQIAVAAEPFEASAAFAVVLVMYLLLLPSSWVEA